MSTETKTVRQVPCKTCTRPTGMLVTQLCDRCWQLERVLEGARVMIQDLRSRDAVRDLLLGVLEAYVPTGPEAPLPRGYWHHLRAAAAAASAGPWARGKTSDAIVSGDEKRVGSVDAGHLHYYGGFVVAESMQPSDQRYVLLTEPSRGLAIANLMLRAEDTAMTLEQARVIRSWAVDLECSNARVAELFELTWGGGGDFAGDVLCAEARKLLGEAW